MKLLLLSCLLLCGCAGNNPAYVPGGGYPAANSAMLIHGDLTQPNDFFFGDGMGGGMLIHGDLTTPPDFISGF